MKKITRRIGTGICLVGLVVGVSILGIYKHTQGKRLERERQDRIKLFNEGFALPIWTQRPHTETDFSNSQKNCYKIIAVDGIYEPWMGYYVSQDQADELLDRYSHKKP